MSTFGLIMLKNAVHYFTIFHLSLKRLGNFPNRNSILQIILAHCLTHLFHKNEKRLRKSDCSDREFHYYETLSTRYAG